MKSKPFTFLFFCLMIFPYAVLNNAYSQNQRYNSLLSTDIQVLSDYSDPSSNPLQAYNQLINSRWKKPLESQEVIEKLEGYKGRALISFFDFEERDNFCQEAIQLGINVEKIYEPIPATTISYNQKIFRGIDFSQYKVKYIYPIGSYSYSIPQNIDVGLGSAIELSDIREALEIDALHQLNHTGYGVRIAVLDSGMNFSEAPALVGLLNYPGDKIVSSFKAAGLEEDINDLSGHGTHIASIIAGNGKFIENGEIKLTNNYGIAPDAQLLNIKVLDKTGIGLDEWLIDGFALAITVHSNIISASLTSITFAEIGDPLEELMYEAGRQGIIVVGSAGNYGPSGTSVGAPAIWDYVISVGATQNLQDLALYTASGLNQNFSAGVDVLAPGNGIAGSDAGHGGYRYLSGTSISAPLVTGIIALLMQAYPNLKPQNYEVAICDTAIDLNHPIVFQGNGLVNPKEAYNYLTTYQNDTVFTINPTRISPENFYFYECVEGKTTEFKVKIISSDDQLINTSVSGDSQFIEIAEQYQVFRGWNHIGFNISIPMNTTVRDINTEIQFFNIDGVACNLDITIQTRYFGGTILFDVSLENDTENRWFDSSAPYGVYQYLGRRLKDRGYHIRYHSENVLQASDLVDVNILVIADPEYNLVEEYIDTIYDFVYNGGSLLFMINSIRFIKASNVTTDPILSSNYTLCNEILARFDASVGSHLPIPYVPYTAEVTSEADMLNTDSFIFWGWPVTFSKSSSNTKNRILATYEVESMETAFYSTLSTEIGNGRVMIFGSSYPFTDLGLLQDSYETKPQQAELDNSYKEVFALDPKNSQLVNDTFDWLIATNRPRITVDIVPERVLIRHQIRLSFDILKKDGVPYYDLDRLDGTIIYPDHTYEHITYNLNESNTREITGLIIKRYEIYLTFTEYGWHTIYIPLKLTNHTVTDGRIDIFCDVALWDKLSLIQSISTVIAIFIIVAVVLIPLVRSRFLKEIEKK